MTTRLAHDYENEPSVISGFCLLEYCVRAELRERANHVFSSVHVYVTAEQQASICTHNTQYSLAKNERTPDFK
jgi:hypothetical protein